MPYVLRPPTFSAENKPFRSGLLKCGTMRLRLFLGILCALPPLAFACTSSEFTTTPPPSTSDASKATPADGAPPFVPGADDDDDTSDSSTDAALAACSATAVFKEPTRIAGLPEGAIGIHLSADETKVTFHVGGQKSIYQATRPTRLDSFGTPMALALTIDQTDAGPDSGYSGPPSFTYASITGDDSRIYVAAASSIFTAPSSGAGFAPLQRLPQFTQNGFYFFTHPFIREDGSELYVANTFFSVGDIRVAPVNGGVVGDASVMDIGSVGRNRSFVVTADGLTGFYSTDREGDAGGPYQIWRVTRASTSLPFSGAAAVVELRAIGATGANDPTWISRDNCRLYFESNRSGTMNSYVAERAL